MFTDDSKIFNTTKIISGILVYMNLELLMENSISKLKFLMEMLYGRNWYCEVLDVFLSYWLL